MAELPVVSGRSVVRALERAGFVVTRRRGSHVVLRHPAQGRVVVVPVHGNRALPGGTLRNILRGAGLTVDQFRALLR